MQKLLDKLKEYNRFSYRFPSNYKWLSMNEATDFMHTLAERVEDSLSKKYKVKIFGNEAASDLLSGKDIDCIIFPSWKGEENALITNGELIFYSKEMIKEEFLENLCSSMFSNS